MPSSEQIRESIEARIGELRSEMKSLETARAALQANGASRARSRPADAAARKAKRRRSSTSASESTATATPADPPPTPARSEPSTRTVARSREPRTAADRKPTTRRKRVAVLFAGTLETILRDAEDGLNAVAIARQARARDTQVRDLLRELERTGRVRRTGVGRGSRWTLITNAERIAERAAELEALSTPKP